MSAETVTITERPVAGVGRCSIDGCERAAAQIVSAAGSVIHASTFTCHGHVVDGHVKALRMFAQTLEDATAEGRGEYEPVTF